VNETTTPPKTKQMKMRIYFLAHPLDQHISDALHKHLTPLVKRDEFIIGCDVEIEISGDLEIESGEDKQKYREQRLSVADLVLPLVSIDFIDDDDLYACTAAAMKRYNNGETKIVPILVRNCQWERSEFVHLPLLPKNPHRPVTDTTQWKSEDDALTMVVDELVAPIYEFVKNHARHAPAEEAVAEPAVADPAVAENVPPPVAAPVVEESRPDAPGAPAPAAVAEPAAGARRFAHREKPERQLNVDWRDRYYKSTVRRRGFALMLDYLILFFVPLIVISATASQRTANVSVWVIGLGVFYIVCPIMEASAWRATIGKRIMKIQVTAPDGRPISVRRAFFRNILRSFTLYSYFFVLPFFYQWYRFRRTRKLFHDELSSTVIGEALASRGRAAGQSAPA